MSSASEQPSSTLSPRQTKSRVEPPLVRIEIIKGRTAAERKQLLDAVHAALVEAFGIPDDDRTQLIVEHDPEYFEIPSLSR